MTVTAKAHAARDLLLVTLAAAIWFCAFIGLRPLANPDEGRYTEISREMALSGDFVTPRLNGVKYFEKPPLLYWLSAGAFQVFGVNLFTARLWNALFATFGIVIAYLSARELYGRSAGLWTAVVLGTSILYYLLAQIVLLDMALAVTMSGALFSFILAVREPSGPKRMGLFLSLYVFMALATLTKGLIGFLIPGAVIFLWLLLLNKWRSLLPFYPVLGVLLFLAIAAPWHVMAALQNHSDVKEHDFAWFYFVHEHFLRFTTKIHGRYEPWWFFLPFVVAGLFPWTFFALQSLGPSLKGGWKSRGSNAEAWFFIIWIVFIVAFFSKSQSKLIPYILPVFPPAAVMIGRYFSERTRIPSDGKLRAGAWGFAGFSLVLGMVIILIPIPHAHDSLAVHLPMLRGLVSAVLFGGAALTIVAVRRKQPARIVGTVAVASSMLLVSFAAAGKVFDGGSSNELSKVLAARIKPQDRIYHVGLYEQDMPVYLQRFVSVVGYKGELLFGIESEPEVSAERFIEKNEFLKQWSNPGVSYAVIPKWYYERWFAPLPLPKQIIGESEGRLLIVNHAAESKL